MWALYRKANYRQALCSAVVGRRHHAVVGLPQAVRTADTSWLGDSLLAFNMRVMSVGNVVVLVLRQGLPLPVDVCTAWHGAGRALEGLKW
jgi:hypothetical protein